MSEQTPRYLPPGSMRRERRAGFAAGVAVTLPLTIAALLMLAIVLLAVLRGGNGWGSGCCQPACCAQPACPAPQADRHLLQPDNRTSYVPPCGCQAPLIPWWPPHTPDDTVHSVPEPGTLALITVGSLALWRLT